MNESAPSINITANSVASGIGQFVTNTERRSIDINVKFVLTVPRYKEAERAQVLDAVKTWASGSDLTVNYKPGKKLSVIVANLIAPANPNKFTQDYTLTFRAYMPNWVDEEATKVTAKGVGGGTATLTMKSNAPSPLCLTATNKTNKAVTEVTVGCNGKNIKLTGLNLENGKVLKIYYSKGNLKITQDGNTVLGKRTIDSNDDIIVNMGDNLVTYTANQRCDWTIYSYGRWL